jgi:hypothetical protein
MRSLETVWLSVGMPLLRGVVCVAVAALDVLVTGTSAWAVDDFSKAETQLFMQPHFEKLKLPRQLHYQFSKSGSLEPGFQDKVSLHVAVKQQGLCCQTQVSFLSGEQRLQLPNVDEAKGNPVILYFLERDIRNMQRLTQGQSNYFRTRIRKAIYQAAQERQVMLLYKGQRVAAQEFEITPYQNDPLRERFGLLADKHYVFTLSAAVPGAVVSIRTWVPQPGNADTVFQESLLIEGATL